MAKFSAQHYNAIAKDIREEFARHRLTYDHRRAQNDRAAEALASLSALTDLALKFARRFKADNENFDPLKFLDACTSNPDLYPLSELWELEHGNKG